MEEAAQGDDNQNQDSRKRRAAENASWSHNMENREKKLKRKELKKARKDQEKWEQLPEDEKQKALETERMIKEIRLKNEQQLLSKHPGDSKASNNAGGDDEFEGFD
jgi:ATP-dependent RNA helicase DDX55/SPB4